MFYSQEKDGKIWEKEGFGFLPSFLKWRKCHSPVSQEGGKKNQEYTPFNITLVAHVCVSQPSTTRSKRS